MVSTKHASKNFFPDVPFSGRLPTVELASSVAVRRAVKPALKMAALMTNNKTFAMSSRTWHIKPNAHSTIFLSLFHQQLENLYWNIIIRFNVKWKKLFKMISKTVVQR